MNKPIAWIKQGRLGFPVLEFDMPFRYESYAIQNPPIPLYTHPAELTDEEIKEVIRKHWNREYGNRNMLTLCKAILKEANK